MPALFLGTDKIKRHTMRGCVDSPLNFSDLRCSNIRPPSNSVIVAARRATKSVRARRFGFGTNLASVSLLLLAFAVCPLGAGCSKVKHSEHATQMRSPEPAPPTPDTTPVAVLRTPAGLVLGIEGTPAHAGPAPATTGTVPRTTTTPAP